jgi:predicted GIY-YIG superfamily endonuclease
MPAFVYILKDDNGRYYVGSTTNLPRRMSQHRTKHTSTTARMKNPKLCFSEQFDSLTKARRIESKIKLLKRKDYIEKIILDGYIKLT